MEQGHDVLVRINRRILFLQRQMRVKIGGTRAVAYRKRRVHVHGRCAFAPCQHVVRAGGEFHIHFVAGALHCVARFRLPQHEIAVFVEHKKGDFRHL